MGEAPARLVQLRFISKLQKECANSRDLWEHAVSKEWVEELQHFVEDGGIGVSIPPMFLSDWDDNNLYIGEKNWKVLASWYGVDNKYSFRRRSSTTSYVGIGGKDAEGIESYILADPRMDFLTVFSCLLKDLPSDHEKRPYVNIYFWESLDYIEFQLRCLLKVHPSKDVRLWLSLCDEGTDILIDDLSVYDRYTTSLGSVLCGRLPELVEILKKRHSMPSANMSHVYGTTPMKEDLSSVFVSNQWQLTMCLEELSKSFSCQSLSYSSGQSHYNIPKAFHNLQLDGLFMADAKPTDFDDEMKHLLDRSVEEFNIVITDQRDKIEVRSKQLLEKARESYRAMEQQLKVRLDAAEEKGKHLDTREKELNEREHELNTKLAKFKSMLTEFLTKKDCFEKDTERMAEQNQITASRVELNVGGVRYTTSVTTLVNEEGSLLQTMFKGQHALKPDSDGSFFIDRDGTQFRHILNFLRVGQASLQHLPGDNLHILSELRAEAEHYRLHRMVDALRMKMSEGRSASGANFVSLPS